VPKEFSPGLNNIWMCNKPVVSWIITGACLCINDYYRHNFNTKLNTGRTQHSSIPPKTPNSSQSQLLILSTILQAKLLCTKAIHPILYPNNSTRFIPLIPSRTLFRNSQIMYPAVHRPAPKPLPPEPKHHHPKERDSCCNATKHHHWGDIAVLDRPIIYIICLAEAEGILADGGDDHDFACNGFVGVDSILYRKVSKYH